MPVVEPNAVAVIAAFPKADIRTPNGCPEPRIGGPAFFGLALSLDDERRQEGRELDEIDLVRRRCSTFAVIERERAEQGARVVENRHRPAGPEAVRQRDVRESDPEAGLFNVLDDDHLATGRGGPAGTNPVLNPYRTDGVHVRRRQARSRAGKQQPARRVDEQYRAMESLGPGFDVGCESVEQHVEG